MRRDTELLNFLEKHLHATKWDDAWPELRPMDDDGEYLEKYIDQNTVWVLLKKAIDDGREAHLYGPVVGAL